MLNLRGEGWSINCLYVNRLASAIYQMEVGAVNNVERLTYDCFQCMKGQILPDGVNMVMFEEKRARPNCQIAVLNIETLVITLTIRHWMNLRGCSQWQYDHVCRKFGGRVLDAVSIDGRVKFRLPSSTGDVRARLVAV